LLKMKTMGSIGLLLGLLFQVSSWADPSGAVYNYLPVDPPPGAYTGYRWRPAGEGQPQSNNGISDLGGTGAAMPGSEPTSVQPPANFRPLQETEAHSPRVGKYRFRALSADERDRSEQAAASVPSVNSGKVPTRAKFRDTTRQTSSRFSGVQRHFRFRPDQRFSSPVEGGLPSVYPAPDVPPVYAAPVFRE